MKGTGASQRNTTVKVFDFFSGCGGASCGFEAAGMDVVFAEDFDEEAQRTYAANFPDVHFELGDIRSLGAELVLQHVAAAQASPVLLCGCAPC